MIEPTETESKQTLDYFADTMIKIAEEARTNPELLKSCAAQQSHWSFGRSQSRQRFGIVLLGSRID
jgi:glycine cleavage system protein P-like pyridoxal-binding family